MNAETIFDMIMKLTGPIEPVADSAIDEGRLKNVEVFIEVFDKMHSEIDDIAYRFENTGYASVQKIVEKCNKQLDKMGIEE